MKYILAVKDHFTKFTWLRAIKSKEAVHVRVELEHLYCEWGFPFIHQTDNGTEFVANIVTKLFKSHPLCYAVTGKPYCPQEQGSIERMNQEIKKIIAKLTLQKR